MELRLILDKKSNLLMKTLESNLAKSVGVISKQKQVIFINFANFVVYYLTIYPYLLYGIAIWGSTLKKYREKLSALQNKALSI